MARFARPADIISIVAMMLYIISGAALTVISFIREENGYSPNNSNDDDEASGHFGHVIWVFVKVRVE